MIQKKVCLIGAFATGKTSLVSRLVHGIFSEKYLTTIGVKIDKKIVDIDGAPTALILWDLHGEDEIQSLRHSYLRGAAAYLLVVDGTRKVTLERAIGLQKEAEDTIGKIPFVVVLNKSDLKDEWVLGQQLLDDLKSRGWRLFKTSAKTGDGVEEAFIALCRSVQKKGLGAS